VRPIPTQAAIGNEFHQSNLRATVAYARLGGQANSATSQWFVNVEDNVALDTIDGGFTVFGVVIDGMAVVEAIYDLPRLNMDSVCTDPLFAPDPTHSISANFRSTPVPQAFFDSLEGAMTCQDLPSMEAFADAMVDTEVTRVPEPAAAATGIVAVLALAALARGRNAPR
jgi:cyclophilin family peptidyl-prolyl cis-trans isomerase